jgi:hypothetical protein
MSTRSAQTDSSAVALYGVALATLDDDPGVHPDAHAFIIDKAPWFTITDGLRVHCEDGDRSREWRGLHDVCLPGREFIVQVSVTATNIGAVISGLQSLPSVFRN